MRKITSLFFILAIFSVSCITQKDITYLQNLGEQPSDSLFKSNIGSYKVQPFDILHVKISCLDETVNALFSQSESSGASAMATLGGFFIHGNSVDADGFVLLPVIGKVKVAGLTITEVNNTLQAQADKYITDAQIQVHLVSFKISVIGEVKRPGPFTIFKDRANIFEAIAEAGDLTYFANRHKVHILRNVQGGTQSLIVNLTDKNLLSSNLYFLQPNDIIIVEPMRNTAFRLSAADYSVLISTVTASLSTIILILSFIKK